MDYLARESADLSDGGCTVDGFYSFLFRCCFLGRSSIQVCGTNCEKCG